MNSGFGPRIKETSSWMVFWGDSNSHSLPIAPASSSPLGKLRVSFLLAGCLGGDVGLATDVCGPFGTL